MNRKVSRKVQIQENSVAGFDGWLVFSLAGLLGLGLVMVASSSVAVADRHVGDSLYYFWRQLAFTGIGLAAGMALFMVPLRVWSKNGFILLGAAIIILGLVFIPSLGREVNGARRWIDLGPFNLQVSELARLFLLGYLASYAVRRQSELQNTLMGLVKPTFLISVAALLMLMEPDYGATVILLTVTMIVLFMAGARLHHLALLVGGAGAVLAFSALSSPYRVRRLISFTNPWEHPYDSGFQLVQSLIAIGRGEVSGVGLGNSVQKLLYLPEMHTDFLFAILAEELGLIGSIVVVALFALFVWRGFVIATRAHQNGHRFAAFLCYGLTSWVGLQAFINIAVNMGLAPTKGLTLPLMSYGGSSLVVMALVAALMLRVDFESRRPTQESVAPKAKPWEPHGGMPVER